MTMRILHGKENREILAGTQGRHAMLLARAVDGAIGDVLDSRWHTRAALRVLRPRLFTRMFRIVLVSWRDEERGRAMFRVDSWGRPLGEFAIRDAQHATGTYAGV